MPRKSWNHGITLLQVLVSALLGFIVMRFTMMLFSSLSSGFTQGFTKSEAQQELRRAGIYIKNRFGGTRNFQTVGFRFTAVTTTSGKTLPGGQSLGPGFFIRENYYCDGTQPQASPPPVALDPEIQKSDILYGVVQIPTGQQMKLAGSLSASATSASVVLLNSTASLGSILDAGDLVTITRTTSTDIFKVGAAGIPAPGIPPNPPPPYPVPIDREHTYSSSGAIATSLNADYVAGDYLDKVQIVMICLDHKTRELRAGPYNFPSAMRRCPGTPPCYDVIGKGKTAGQQLGVTRFQLFYNLKPSNVLCPTVTTGDIEYQRMTTPLIVGWTTLNTASVDNACYRRLLGIQSQFDTQYQVSNPLSGTQKKTLSQVEYIFTSNFNQPNKN